MNKEQTKALATAVVTTLVANLTVKYGMAAVDRLVAEVSNKRRRKHIGFVQAPPKRRLPVRLPPPHGGYRGKPGVPGPPPRGSGGGSKGRIEGVKHRI